MDEVIQAGIRILGAILRFAFELLFEALFGKVFEPPARWIAGIYADVLQFFRGIVRFDVFAVPITLLFLLAIVSAILFAAVRALQWALL